MLPISRLGTLSVNPNLKLKDILLVPNIKMKLLSVSKLTNDYPVDFLFSRFYFAIQDSVTKIILATGKHKDGLYVLNPGFKALVALVISPTKASFELWHKRLGHVACNVISILNKYGFLNVTSILPKPSICPFCELSKQHHLPFQLNEKRSLHVLDMVHCDLWGPSPVTSVDGYRYYDLIVDDYLRFSWFYPLKIKSDFLRC